MKIYIRSTYEDPEFVEQQYTSEKTSINSSKLPAIFRLVHFQPNTVNFDIGGGKFDNATEYLAELGVTNHIWDPYNRSTRHNSEVLHEIAKIGGADTVTCSNVLNVIAEESARLATIKNCYKYLKPNGVAYFTVYEGSGSGSGSPTKSGYQLNRKTAEYIDEISQIFNDVVRKGKLIVARK